MGGAIKRLLIGNDLRRTLIRGALLLVATFVIFRFVFAPLRLDGQSMEPTFRHGQFSLANRLAYFGEGPERGDVVAVRMTNRGGGVFLLKRVVGLPGEWIGFEEGKVTVNGVRQEEAYLTYPSDWTREAVLCGEHEYFVVGDNRSMPIEAHTLGRTLRNRIAGKVLF